MSRSPVPGLTANRFQMWLTGQLLPRLPEPDHWAATPDGVFKRPWKWFARGIAFSGSSGPWFSAHAVVVPLFVPTTIVSLTHGQDLPGPGGQRGFDQVDGSNDGQRAQEVADSFVANGLSLIEGRGQLRGFLDHLLEKQDAARSRGASVPYTEVAGYCLLLLGDEARAVEQLARATQPLPSDAPPWDVASRNRAQEVLALVDDPAAATGLLRHWAEDSAISLGLRQPTG